VFLTLNIIRSGIEPKVPMPLHTLVDRHDEAVSHKQADQEDWLDQRLDSAVSFLSSTRLTTLHGAS
jgi:hypothetical protein